MSRRRTFIHTGKNSELPREVFSRPAARSLQGSSLPNCGTGFSSGSTPVAVAVRSDRRPAEPLDRVRGAPRPVEDLRDDPFFWWDIAAIFLIGCGTVGLLTVALL